MLYKQKAELLDKTKEEWMMECVSKEKYDNMESPRILNTHIHFSMLPKDLLRRKCKLVYTTRNPKDVAVSFYHHHYNILIYGYNGSWDSYIKRFLDGNGKHNIQQNISIYTRIVFLYIFCLSLVSNKGGNSTLIRTR